MLPGYRRGGLVLLLLGIALTAPGSAQAAYVTAVDVSVRPAEGSPWSKGTLFTGEGFSVGATTGNGWAWGRAGGEADRCGWVLISELNSTTHTDTQCGSPQSEPLNDSEHVPGGGASERWYVTCDSATLFGNYGGAAGVLRSPAGSASKGNAVGWRYTTANGYAASIDGPTGTPRFILRSCISRTPPAGPAPPGGPPGGEEFPIGPPPSRLMDEEGIYALYGPTPLVSVSAFAAARRPRVQRTRATIRLAPGNIVIANGLKGDPFESAGTYCKGWVRGTIIRGSQRYGGWVQASALSRTPRRTRSDCGAAVQFRDRIAFVNAPFRSITFLRSKKGRGGRGAWSTTGSASQARLRQQNGALAPDCTLHMNYVPGAGLQDPVVGKTASLVFRNGDQSPTTKTIGYRYTSPDGSVALVSVRSGYKKRPPRGKPRNVGLWSFVKRDCVRTLKEYNPASSVNRIYQTEIRICDRIRPSVAVRRFNRRRSPARRRAAVKPCSLPNAATQPGRPRPDNAAHGWNIGSLRR